MKKIGYTFKECLKLKQGALLFAGTIVGILVAWFASNFIAAKGLSTIITMVGAMLSILAGNGFMRVIYIVQQRDETQ